MNDLNSRLNKVRDRLSSLQLLSNSGLGNEIGFYIFDYPAKDEVKVRSHLLAILPQVHRRLIHLDLFRVVVDYLEDRGLLTSALDIQLKQGDDSLMRALKGPLDEESRIAPEISRLLQQSEYDALVLSGVGNVYPLVRVHRLLNCLQPVMAGKPLVVFYPGEYSGQTLSLFGELKDDNYYRAFRLV